MGARALALIGLCATPVLADYDPSQYPAYETCALCHGLFGVSHTAKFPNLGGQRVDYIEAQIRAFIGGHRSNDGGQMVNIVSELHPEDIPFVADWFSSQDPPAPYPADDTTRGAAIVNELGCETCHTNTADGDPAVPYLTAQHPGYLVKQMTDFREDRRDVKSAPGMHKAMMPMSDADIEAIATYLSAQERP